MLMKLLIAVAVACCATSAVAQQSKKKCTTKQIVVAVPIGGVCTKVGDNVYVCYIQECK